MGDGVETLTRPSPRVQSDHDGDAILPARNVGETDKDVTGATPEKVEAFQELSSKPCFSQELPTLRFTTTSEFIKSVLAPNFEVVDSTASHISWEPKVNQLKVVEHDTHQSVGSGRITVRGTGSDPLHSIPIKTMSELSYVSGPSDYTIVADHDLGAMNGYLPYLAARHYGDLQEFKVGLQWTNMEDDERVPQGDLRLRTPLWR
ncbi:hypothetical protein N0V84_004393 [Fusarium piperis]|uniref:Uncharacterized protein n=1 Tax=Fusarium piperis TaxID=1435070 RepID=A0A9W8WFM2_9HYPO|nr:hypothetical protein N0V84_004393 [Fusarium piperis]